MLRSYLQIVLIFSVLSVSCEVNNYVHDNDQLARINTLKEVASKHYKAKEYIKSEKYFDEALQIAKKYGIHNKEADFLLNKGVLNFKLGHYKQSIIAYEEAIDLYIFLEDKYKLALALKYLGQSFNKLQIYENALTAFIEAAALFKEVNKEKKLAQTYSLIGVMYKWLDMYDLSIEYHKKALEIRERNKDLNMIAKSYHNLGNAYLNAEDQKQALFYFNKVLLLKDQLRKKSLFGKTHSRLAHLYFNQGNFKKSELHNLQSYEIRNKNNNKPALIESANKLGLLYIKMNKVSDAKKYLEIAKSLATEKNNYEELLLNHKYFLELSKIENKESRALHHFKEIENLQKLIIEEEKERNIISQKSKLHLSDFQMKMVSHQLTLNKKKKQNKGLIYLGSLGLLMALGFVQISRSNKETYKKLLSSINNNSTQKTEGKLLVETFKSIDQNFNTILDLLHYESFDDNISGDYVCSRIQHRLDIMYYVHNNICSNRSEIEAKNISLRSYIEYIVANLRLTYGKGVNLNLKLNIENSQINPIRAIHLGLIVNEILSDVFSKGIREMKAPELSIDAQVLSHNILELNIGINKKIGFNDKNIIIKKMLNQLEGELSFENKKEGAENIKIGVVV